MLRAAWILVLVGACASAAGQTDETSSSACNPREDELLGCCAAGNACTWAAPIGERCTDAFTSFCDHGLGWCDGGVCRDFCSPVELPRCQTGAERFVTLDAEHDVSVCLCVPE